jgi:hypothetical protein
VLEVARTTGIEVRVDVASPDGEDGRGHRDRDQTGRSPGKDRRRTAASCRGNPLAALHRDLLRPTRSWTRARVVPEGTRHRAARFGPVPLDRVRSIREPGRPTHT